MRVIKVLAPALAAAVLYACVDGPLSTRSGGVTALSLAPQFSFAGPTGGLPIEFVRTTPRFVADGTPAGPQATTTVSSDAESFTVMAEVDLGDRDSASVVVLIEMFSNGSGSDIVEWSAWAGPILVDADEAPQDYVADVTMVRGPIENLGVESLTVHGPSFMYGTTSSAAYATVAAQGSYTVIWSSSNRAVADVDPVSDTDTVLVHALTSGSAWIRAGAGLHADSFLVQVDVTEAGELAFVDALPDSAVVIVGATRAWQAYATDSAGVPVAATFGWQSLDPTVAGVSSSGVVSGVSVGRARIVASAGGIADTAIAIIETLPAGVDLVWQGGTPGAEDDWFTADNWSPARVPTGTDVVYFAAGAPSLVLDANAEVGGILGDSLSYQSVLLAPDVTLTVHGDVTIPYLSGDTSSLLVIDGASATLWGYSLPPIVVRGSVSVQGQAYAYGDVTVETGATLDVGVDDYLFVTGDLTVIGGGLMMSEDTATGGASLVVVTEDIVFDGGDSSTRLVGGYLEGNGDFTVTAASCTAFRPTNVITQLIADTASISIGCPGMDGNRFWDLYVYSNQGGDRIIELLSDLPVQHELYFGWDPTYPAYVVGNGYTIAARFGGVATSTFDRAFLEVDMQFGDFFYLDSLAFTGMTGETRPQVLVNSAGDGCSCYDWQHIEFDPSSAGPYIELHDLVADGDSIIYYMARNPGDGPQRVVMTGEAAVYWAGIPAYVDVYSGNGQTGPALQPLPDSLVARVVDYGGEIVEGLVVTWTVTDSDGSVSPATSVTDTVGLASTQYTMGSVNYPVQEVVASTPGAASAYFYSNLDGGLAPPQAATEATARPTMRIAPVERREPRDIPIAPTPAQLRDTLDKGERR